MSLNDCHEQHVWQTYGEDSVPAVNRAGYINRAQFAKLTVFDDSTMQYTYACGASHQEGLVGG
jgi:hypothetical protein